MKLTFLKIIFMTLLISRLEASLFHDVFIQPFKPIARSCDTEDLKDKERSEEEFLKEREKAIKKNKHCRLAKITFELYEQHPKLYRQLGGMLPALEALKDGGYFMDFAWEFRNFEKNYQDSEDRELVHYWRVQTYLSAIPDEEKYCTRPQGYYLNQNNRINDLATEATVVFKLFERDWSSSAYLKESGHWWQTLSNYQTSYAACKAETRYNIWKHQMRENSSCSGLRRLSPSCLIQKSDRHPGPLIAAYEDLAVSISRDQASPLLDKTLFWSIKVLMALSTYEEENREIPSGLSPHLAVARKGQWRQKAQKILNLLETHFPESPWTIQSKELIENRVTVND